MTCKHEQFYCTANVFRLHEEDDETKDVKSYSMDVKVHCVQCGTPFEFIGLPLGLSPHQPMASFDATEARMPIRPSNKPIENNTLSN